MENFNILTFIENHLDLLISVVISVVFLIVNIIQAIRSHDKSRLKIALLKLPEVIREIEELSKNSGFNSSQKKSSAEALCSIRFGKIYKKNVALFQKAIEDILDTPQKKGGSLNVSKTHEER